MKKILYLGLSLTLLLTACNKDDDKYYKEPANEGGTMELQGGEGGASAKNSVYVDLSQGEQLPVERVSWHLALHCGSAFGVRLNNTTGSHATEAGSGVSVGSVLSAEEKDNYLAVLSPSMGEGDFSIADKIDSDTDLAGTVIKKDKVYIYCSGDDNQEMYKVSVGEKNSNTYTVSYALWNSSEVKNIDIAKDASYNFTGVSFTSNKQVNIQPKKDSWDIVWGRNTYTSAMAPGVPFVLADVVFINTKAGVTAKELLVADYGTYDEFTAEKATGVQLSSDIDVIGSAWRNGGGPSTQPSVKTDRFYLIKDAQGNIYKLGFVSMCEGTDGGKRGYPEIKYSLLVEAE